MSSLSVAVAHLVLVGLLNSTNRVAVPDSSQGKRPKIAPPLDHVRQDFRALRERNILSPASRALLIRDAIPGLRSLHSLTQGNIRTPLRDWLTRRSMTLCWYQRY